MIYGEQQVLWEGQSAQKVQVAAFPGRSKPLPLFLIHTFPAWSTLEEPFYLKQRQASYLIYRLQGRVTAWLVAKVSFKWKAGWRDITYILPAIC